MVTTRYNITVKFSFEGDTRGLYVAEVEGFPYLTKYAGTYEEAYALAEDALHTTLFLLRNTESEYNVINHLW